MSHVDRRQLVLELEIDLLLSPEPPHVELAIIVQIAEKEHQCISSVEMHPKHTSAITECKSIKEATLFR